MAADEEAGREDGAELGLDAAAAAFGGVRAERRRRWRRRRGRRSSGGEGIAAQGRSLSPRPSGRHRPPSALRARAPEGGAPPVPIL